MNENCVKKIDFSGLMNAGKHIIFHIVLELRANIGNFRPHSTFIVVTVTNLILKHS